VGNVSAVFGSPRTVVVDTTDPTVTAFTATTPTNSLDIPITAFTATDTVGVTGYLITTSSTPPSAGAGGWSGTAPTTYHVASAGSYTLYPWAKDAVGNVSAVFGSPRTVVVDTTTPTPTNGPTGTITTTLPTYQWDMVTGATQYEIQLLDDAGTVVYSQIVPSSGCGATTCSIDPNFILNSGKYKWTERAYVDGLWTGFSEFQTFTIIEPTMTPVPTATKPVVPVAGVELPSSKDLPICFGFIVILGAIFLIERLKKKNIDKKLEETL
jgi:hypothetical protein